MGISPKNYNDANNPPAIVVLAGAISLAILAGLLFYWIMNQKEVPYWLLESFNQNKFLIMV